MLLYTMILSNINYINTNSFLKFFLTIYFQKTCVYSLNVWMTGQ